MTKVMLDQSAIQKLSKVPGPVLICDEMGRVLGQFDPALDRDEIPFTEAELERFAGEPGGRTLCDILKDLEKLP